MSNSSRNKGRARDQERRLERHRINAAASDCVAVRHGYSRTVSVSAVAAND